MTASLLPSPRSLPQGLVLFHSETSAFSRIHTPTPGMHTTIAARRAAVKSWTLANGAQIPKIGFGTWKLKKEQAGPAVQQALKTGFRHIDSAWAHRSEY